jgi:hypothetical protein
MIEEEPPTPTQLPNFEKYRSLEHLQNVVVRTARIDSRVVFDETIENFFVYFSDRNEKPKEAELLAALTHCV